MNLKMLKITQPIGEFFLGKIDAQELKKYIETGKIKVNSRKTSTSEGIQRELSTLRTKEIAKYTLDRDATFPTPIIIAIEQDAVEDFDDNNEIVEIKIKNEVQYIGDIIDGQHRMFGLINSINIEKFQMPVVFMIGLTLEEKADVFSIINSKQTKVDRSLIYDLFGLSNERSPQKICHEIAKLMNSDTESPYYECLKMLGKKEKETESLSQGTFVKYLMKLISKNSDEDRRNLKNGKVLQKIDGMPFRTLFIQEKDEGIYKILKNVFRGLKNNYKKEWNGTILTKTVTYCAVMASLNDLYTIGAEKKDLSEQFFTDGFKELDNVLSMDNLVLLNDFTSGGSANAKLAQYIIKAFEKVYTNKK